MAKIPKLNFKAILAVRKRQATLALVILLLAVGIFGVQKIFHKKPQPANNDTLTYSTDKPDEKKPGDDYKWVGGPKDPKKIFLPTINKDGFIQKVGVDQHKAMAVPGNIHVAGWFTSSPIPGVAGPIPSVIDGHVDGLTDRGIFYDLKNIKKGDQFSIEYGDGHKQNFKVADIQNVPNAQAAGILYSVDPKLKNQLNLITCGGKFDKEKREYENRIIVIAETV